MSEFAAGQPSIIFVSGLSGSGKTTAMGALEDLGYYSVDHLPAQLVHQFLDLCAKTSPAIEKVAFALDSRESSFLRNFPDAVRELRARGADVEVVFLDCSNQVLEQRYRETRRVHPLSPMGSVVEGIELERQALTDAAGLADRVIDTSSMTVHQLKDAMFRKVAGVERHTVVNLISFGFRHGTPASVELLFDLRCLPNPYFEPALQNRSGLDREVSDYVLESQRGRELLRRIVDLIEFLLPLYDAEGKAYLTIGLGCTGGMHRSVAVAAALGEALKNLGREANLEHRDVEREIESNHRSGADWRSQS